MRKNTGFALFYLNRTCMCLGIRHISLILTASLVLCLCLECDLLPLWYKMSQARETSEGSQMNFSWLILVYLLLQPSWCEGFLPNFWSKMVTLSWDSHTHQYITEKAILNVTVEVLRGTSKHQVEGKVSFLNAPFSVKLSMKCCVI